MGKIVEWVRKHPLLYYCGAVGRLAKNEESRKRVTGIIDNPRNIIIEKRGNMNKGTLVYEIDPVVRYSGYFAVFRRLLSALYFADEIGAQPYVTYNEDFMYAEDHPVNGVTNPYEYYFRPIKCVPEENIEGVNSVICFEAKHTRMAEMVNGDFKLNYRVTDEYLQALSRVCRKYVAFNDFMNAYVKNGIKELGITDHTLAVHCRGTDFNLGSRNHPIIVTVEDYFKFIDEVLKKGNYDKIFLATDDEKRLMCFKEKYGEKVCYYHDVKRTTGTEGVHFSTCSRKNHRYWLGAEVIRDAYTMASCGGLVAGMSEVSICTRIFKQANNEKFQDIVIIDKGIIEKGKYFVHE